MSIDRRNQERLPLRLRVEYESMEDFLTDFSANLSVGGMFIETDRPLSMGTRFRLRFYLPDFDEPVDTEAEVRWVLDSSTEGPLPCGMGIRFTGMNPKDEVQIRTLLSSWELAD